MSVFEFDDYKEFYNDWVVRQPKGGHGEYRRLALALEVSTTMISQVFKGDKNLSLELACDVCEYLSLSDDEVDYFLLLVELSRAGSYKLRKRLLRQIKRYQQEARKLEKLLTSDVELDEKVKSVFYSSWMYSGIRLLSDVDGYDNSHAIAERLNIPRNLVKKVVDYLVKHQLCVLSDNKLKMGPTRTHLSSSEPLAVRHHQNWRLKGFENMVHLNDDKDMFFTSPLSMSQEVAEQIRQKLPQIISEITAPVYPSKGEAVRCLNVDWFEY